MLIILTKPTGIHPFTRDWLLYYIRKISSKKRGPSAVLESLIDGLKSLNENCLLNPFREIETGSTVIVLSGISATKEAIKLKSKGIIKKLIVGPNITISPIDEDYLLKSHYIDKIIVPSEWVRDFFLTFDTELNKKIIIWPAGVIVPETEPPRSLREQILIFKKNTDEFLFRRICEYLQSNNIFYKIIEYGKFNRNQYIDELKKSKFMIYLQEIESQGIALIESWSMNTPTLVWSPGRYDFTKYNRSVFGNINAPYLSNKSGDCFKDFDDFKIKLSSFLENLSNYSPYIYVKENFDNRITSANLLSLIKQ